MMCDLLLGWRAVSAFISPVSASRLQSSTGKGNKREKRKMGMFQRAGEASSKCQPPTGKFSYQGHRVKNLTTIGKNTQKITPRSSTGAESGRLHPK